VIFRLNVYSDIVSAKDAKKELDTLISKDSKEWRVNKRKFLPQQRPGIVKV